jgi:polyisoprenoid-binding protein YceI
MPDTATPVRTVDGYEVPAAGRWRIDPGHAEVGFVGRHLLFTKVRGRFRSVEGHVDVAEDPKGSTVELTIDMASVDSGSAVRDEHLRSADLFDVDRFPSATFRGRLREWSGRTGTLVGELSLKGTTRPIELRVAFLGAASDPWGGERAVFSASGTLNREEWGITWNIPLAGGGVLVSKELQIELELETVLDR